VLSSLVGRGREGEGSKRETRYLATSHSHVARQRFIRPYVPFWVGTSNRVGADGCRTPPDPAVVQWTASPLGKIIFIFLILFFFYLHILVF
jgi:hypothetical protein